MREMREFYQQNLASLSDILSTIEDCDEEELVKFTGEEHWGKYLDLQPLYLKYCNLGPQFERLDYITYLDRFASFHEIPRELKVAEYRAYLSELLAYLRSFHTRVHPLLDLDKVTEKIRADFMEEWNKSATAPTAFSVPAFSPSPLSLPPPLSVSVSLPRPLSSHPDVLIRCTVSPSPRISSPHTP